MAKECEKPRNVESIQCRNCDDYGHTSRDCPKPRDCKFAQEIQLKVRWALTLLQTLVFSAKTARRWATPKSAARSLSLRMTLVSAPAPRASPPSTHLLTLLAVLLVVVVGKGRINRCIQPVITSTTSFADCLYAPSNLHSVWIAHMNGTT